LGNLWSRAPKPTQKTAVAKQLKNGAKATAKADASAPFFGIIELAEIAAQLPLIFSSMPCVR